MRELDSIRPINLERRKDKLLAYYGGMRISRTPLAVIKPFYAHDAADYKSSFEVREAASKEFIFWRRMHDDWIKKGHLKKGTLCCLWSMQSLLRIIGEGEDNNKLSFMCTDGLLLSTHFEALCGAVRNVESFDILQLWHWSCLCDEETPQSFPTPVLGDYRISSGLGGCGDGLVVSPRGARQILSWCEDYWYYPIERLMGVKSFESPSDCVSTISPSDWCCPHIDLESVFGHPDSERELLDSQDNLCNETGIFVGREDYYEFSFPSEDNPAAVRAAEMKLKGAKNGI